MKFKALFATAAIAAAVCATHAWADNEPEPTGTQVLNLNGQAIPHAYQQYTADFVATDSSTNLSFAFREDPAFLFLDDVSLTDVTTSSGELVTNGGFEDGVVGASAPNGWTYLNVFGAAFGGVVENNAFIA